MPDPGYGPNGERIDPSGLVAWRANPPPKLMVETDFKRPATYALGVRSIPWIDQDDNEAWKGVYLGGV